MNYYKAKVYNKDPQQSTLLYIRTYTGILFLKQNKGGPRLFSVKRDFHNYSQTLANFPFICEFSAGGC